MACWDRVKKLLGFDSHHGPDAETRRPAAKQFKRLRSWGVPLEDHEDDGIPLSRNVPKLAETTIIIEGPGRIYVPKSGETIILKGDDIEVLPFSSKPD